MGRTVIEDRLSCPFLGTSLDDTFEATTSGIVDAVFQTSGGADIISGTNSNDDGVGIVNTVIVSGEGDDVITARGTSLGVENVLIVGGRGNDTYDIQNGTGVIYDEAGNDLLILEGQKSDYSFNGGTYIGNITTFDFNTDLTVIGVDSFQFSDGTFTFDDLFSVGENIVRGRLTGEFGGTTIDGGEGGDIFDLQSGTGTVLGGKGDDRLILEGQSSDYIFQGISTSLLAGEITGIDFVGVRTDLTLVGVENFQFSDGTFTFGELFV